MLFAGSIGFIIGCVMVYTPFSEFSIASVIVNVYTSACSPIILESVEVYPLVADQVTVYGGTPPVMFVEMAPFPRNVPSSKQVAFVIVAVTFIGAVTLTVTSKGVPKQPLMRWCYGVTYCNISCSSIC